MSLAFKLGILLSDIETNKKYTFILLITVHYECKKLKYYDIKTEGVPLYACMHCNTRTEEML